jgi:NitT/TauT family transport system substrate-binding protein
VFRYPRDARLRRLASLVAVAALATSLAACGSDDSGSSGAADDGGGDEYEVKLGYFPNLTHASAIVGKEKGFVADALAEEGASVKYLDFNSGSDTIDSLLGGSLDATYIGPSPAITAFAQSQGGVSIISGATSGGASLMVNPSITSAQDLDGTTIATPGLANTQDVALKYWLNEEDFEVSPDGQGDVTVVNQDNSLTVQTYAQGEIDGAWVPEPYAAILETKGAVKLLDEAELWPQGKFVTTHLLVSNDFLDEHPTLVEDLLQGQIASNSWIAENNDEAKQLVADTIFEVTQTEIPAAALDPAWEQLTFTNDPIADSLIKDASDAVDVGLLEPIDNLPEIYNLEPLNKLLADAGEPEVAGPSS